MWETLKKILKTSNEKAIIIEDGEPKYVILSIDEYMRLNTASTNVQDYQAEDQISDVPVPSQNKTFPTTANQPSSYMQPVDLISAPIDLSDIDVSEEPSSIELNDNSNLGIEDLIF